MPPVIFMESLKAKREQLMRNMLKDRYLRELFNTNHPFLSFSLLNASDEVLNYRISYRHNVLPHRVTVSTFFPDYFAFTMGQDAALSHFKEHFYNSLRALLVYETHEETEEDIERLRIIKDGAIDWAKFESLVDLLTCKFVEHGLFFVGVQQSEETFTLGFKPLHKKITMQPLVIYYDKRLIHNDMAFVSNQFTDDMANTSIKELFAMDLVRTLYQKATIYY